MTKEDFTLIAATLREAIWNEEDLHIAAKVFAAELVKGNPHFNRKDFLDTCGVYYDTPAMSITEL